jgi:hypothetical protein
MGQTIATKLLLRWRGTATLLSLSLCALLLAAARGV